jgi:hypothetical protein
MQHITATVHLHHLKNKKKKKKRKRKEKRKRKKNRMNNLPLNARIKLVKFAVNTVHPSP